MRLRGNWSMRKWIFLIVGVVFFGMGIWDYLFEMKAPVDIYSMNMNDIQKGMHVQTDIYAVYDCFMVETETKTVAGIPVGEARDSAYFYLIPIFTEGSDSLQFMIVKGYLKDSNKFDALIEETYDYMEGSIEEITAEPIHFNGKTVKVDDETRKYYEDWYNDCGFPGNASAYLCPYYLSPSSGNSAGITMLVGGLFAAIGAIWIVVTLVIGKKSNTAVGGYSPIAYGNSQDTYGSSDSVYGASQSTYGSSSSAYGSSSSSYGSSGSAYGSSNSSYGSSSGYGAYSAQTSVQGSSASVDSDHLMFLGTQYLRMDLDSVDYYAHSGRKEEALERLLAISSLDERQAKEIIDRWEEHYAPLR